MVVVVVVVIVHRPSVRNVHRVDGMAVVSLTAHVDVYLIMVVVCSRHTVVSFQTLGAEWS